MLPTKAQIKDGLKVFNKYREIVGKPVTALLQQEGKTEYEYEHILNAQVKRFTKTELTGVNYLGFVTTDGQKACVVLDSPSEVKKKGQEVLLNKFAVADDKKEEPAAV